MPARERSEVADVLVFGAASVAELAVVRGLAAAGYRPSLATWDSRGPAGRARALRQTLEVPSPAGRPGALLDRLVAVAERLRPAAILPGTEAALLLLAEVADRLPADVAAGSPRLDVAQRATDKWSVGEAARESGLGVPQTARLDGASLGEVRLPAVVKSARSERRLPDGGFEHLSVHVARDQAALRAAVAETPDAIVQDYLTAPIRTVNGVAWGGELISTVHQRADRIWRPEAGMLCAARTVAADPDLEEGCGKLLGRLEWSGVFNLQFLDHDGGPLLIDLNPRPYQSLALAVAAGANLPAIWTDLLLGRPVHADGYRLGVCWHYRRDDLRAILAAVRSGRLAAAAAALPRPRTVGAVFSARDPVPAAAVAGRDVMRVLRRLRRSR